MNTNLLLAIVMSALCATTTMAQPGSPEGLPGTGGPRDQAGRGRPDSSRHRAPRPPKLLKALDTDADGSLSAAEIDAAAESLRALDVDGDGTLTRAELSSRPNRPRNDARNVGRGKRGKRAGRNERERNNPGRKKQAGGRDATPEQMVERLIARDEDGDGELSNEELPEHFRKLFARADTDENETLSRDEVTEAVERHLAHRRERHGKRRSQHKGEKKRDRPSQALPEVSQDE